jgi:hypothetical protein
MARIDRTRQSELALPGLDSPLTSREIKQHREHYRAQLLQKFGLCLPDEGGSGEQIRLLQQAPQTEAPPQALNFWKGYALNPKLKLTGEVIEGAVIQGIVEWALRNYLDGKTRGELNGLVYKLLQLDVGSKKMNTDDEDIWIADSLKAGGAGMNRLRKLLRALAFPSDEKLRGKKTLLLKEAQLPAGQTLETLISQINNLNLNAPLELYVRTKASQGKIRKLVGMLSEHNRNILLFGGVERHSPLQEASRFLGEIFHKIAARTLGLTIGDMLKDPDLNLHPDNLKTFDLDPQVHAKFPSDEMLERYFRDHTSSELDKWFPEYASQVNRGAVWEAAEEIAQDSFQRRIFLRLFYLFTNEFKITMAETEAQFEELAVDLELTVEEFAIIHIAALELVGQNFIGGIIAPLQRLSRYLFRVQAMIHHGEVVTSPRYNKLTLKDENILHIVAEKMYRVKVLVPEFQIYEDLMQFEQLGMLQGISNNEFVKPDLVIETFRELIIVDWKTGLSLRQKSLEPTAVSYAIGVNHALRTYPGGWDTSGPRLC